MHPALLFAKQLDGKGGATDFTHHLTANTGDSIVWYHFDANHSDAEEEIKRLFPDFDEHSLQAVFDPDARPRTLQQDNAILIILRGINHNEGDAPEDMVAIRLWVSEQRIISLRYRKSKIIMQISDSLDRGKGPKTIGDTIATICSRLSHFIDVSVNKLNEKMDDLESRVLDTPNRSLRQDISETRKTAILLRRYFYPQKEAINQLRYTELEWLKPTNLRKIIESLDLLLRSIEELDAIRERSQVVKDELINSLSDKLNRNLYFLSVITAIFLPLGFLTGLFGINIGGMPGVDNNDAFYIFLTFLTIVVGIQIVLFRMFKWF